MTEQPLRPPKGRCQIHLFRGAPCVRSWSRHQQTVERWTLCGIERESQRSPLNATEDPSLVSCRFCHQLMRSGAIRQAKEAHA